MTPQDKKKNEKSDFENHSVIFVFHFYNLIIMKKRDLAVTEGWLSIIANTLLFGLKYWAGIVSGSVALIADAWHTLTDSLSSVIVLVSAKISRKPADKKHPYGHGRAELVASIVIGVLLVVIGLEFILKGIERLQTHEQASYGIIAIIVTAVSILLKEGMAQYALYAARKSGNSAVKADAWHHRTDALSSVVILVGIFLGKYYWWIDGVLSIIVALLIFYASWEILHEAVNKVIGTEPSEELKNDIQQLADNIAGYNMQLHHIHLHDYGNHKEMTCHICMPGELTIFDSHEKASKIEKAVFREFGIVLTIHVEPIDTDSCLK